jgi:hypothetical protein
MKDRFPRTPIEFRDHRRGVAMRCECGATTWLKPENLIQRLGPDFDLYDGYADLLEAFPCDVCGRRQRPTFTNPGQQQFGRVAFEQALANSMELSAFALARDAVDLGVRRRSYVEGGTDRLGDGGSLGRGRDRKGPTSRSSQSVAFPARAIRRA